MLTGQSDSDREYAEKAIESIKNTPIIIDSCILLYCEGQVFKLEIRKILRLLANNDNNLKISDLSGFEVLKNAQLKYWNYFSKLLDYIGYVKIDEDIIFNSLNLFKAYEYQPINGYQKISSCDFLIGGTVAYFKGLLFTANRDDFPNPLWNIIAHTYITYKLGSRYELINLYLLKPNYKLIDELKRKFIKKEK